MSILSTIEAKLRAEFAPTLLQLGDDSAAHAGHAGNPSGQGVSHISILIVSEKFAGLSRLERSRAVHAAIDSEIKMIHAITQMKTLTPGEYQK